MICFREEKYIAKLERYMDIKMPFEKPSREKAPPKTVVKILTGDELQHRVIGNQNQLIAIFCRKGTNVRSNAGSSRASARLSLSRENDVNATLAGARFAERNAG